jgi:RNA polymerase sigma-70 factor (ECF subfamily)
LAKPIHITKEQAEERIIQLLLDKDEKALRLIFDRYGNAMLNSIRKILRNEAMAEDVLQDVLVKVWKKGQTYNKGRGSLFTWLISISRNAAIDKTRSKEYNQALKSTALDEFVYTEGEASLKKSKLKELKGNVQEMVSQLDDHEQQLVRMSFFEGFTHVEIAKELSMPLGTIKTRIRSAINKLRQYV